MYNYLKIKCLIKKNGDPENQDVNGMVGVSRWVLLICIPQLLNVQGVWGPLMQVVTAQ